jgi:hypothetical protein
MPNRPSRVHSSFEVSTVVTLRIPFFWDVTLRQSQKNGMPACVHIGRALFMATVDNHL